MHVQVCTLNSCFDISVYVCVHRDSLQGVHALMYAQFVHSALGDEGGGFQLGHEVHLLLGVPVVGYF